MANRNYLYAVLFASICVNAADAERIRGHTFEPTSRVIGNTTAYVKENPRDARGYYALARIHYIAFKHRAYLWVVAVTEPGPPPEIAPDWMLRSFNDQMRMWRATELVLPKFGYSAPQYVASKHKAEFAKAVNEKEAQLRKEGWAPKKLKEEESIRHATEALRNFRTAITLQPSNALYHLGLARLLEQYVHFLVEVKPSCVPDEFRTIMLGRAKDAYYRAYELSIKDDLERKYLPPVYSGLRSLISYEAGEAYVSIAKADGSAADGEKGKLSEVEDSLKNLEQLPPFEW